MENICRNDALKVGMQPFSSICKEVVKNRKLLMQLIEIIFVQMFNRYASIRRKIIAKFINT